MERKLQMHVCVSVCLSPCVCAVLLNSNYLYQGCGKTEIHSPQAIGSWHRTSWSHPGSTKTTILRDSRLGVMCTSQYLDPCSLSSEHITWSWRAGIVSPSPLCSASWSFSCHTAAGEPSQKGEDRNWPIVDLGQFRLRQSSWESGRLSFPDNSEQEVTAESGALWHCYLPASFPWTDDRVVLLKPLVVSFQNSCFVRYRRFTSVLFLKSQLNH